MAADALSHQQSIDAGQPLQKDFSRQGPRQTYIPYQQNGYGGESLHVDDAGGMESHAALGRSTTTGSISISPELFEKIYLSPPNVVKGDLRKTFGNPTPLALLGFLISLTPLACDLMGWRGAGGLGAASTGAYYFFGGLLMIVGGLLEFFLGNTFPFVVFSSYGAFWMTFAATLQPFYNAYGAYAPAGSPPAAGLAQPAFESSFAFLLLFMGVLTFIYLICSVRTNIVFVIIFLSLGITFCLLAGSYWHLAQENAQIAHRLTVGGGASAFVTCMAGWWLFFAIMLAAVDFPLQLPVGDLSSMIKGASERAAEKEKRHLV
ncbi:MAG: hypothetical protein M1818_000953 [Claussenomyces sp. TS43310]|nr:MAG: hypothetical protein M1818_000953 [Claussenomyces sp. TS43310]